MVLRDDGEFAAVLRRLLRATPRPRSISEGTKRTKFTNPNLARVLRGSNFVFFVVSFLAARAAVTARAAIVARRSIACGRAACRSAFSRAFTTGCRPAVRRLLPA